MLKAFILCTVVISLACVCVAVLSMQWRQIQMLRVELLNLEQQVKLVTGSRADGETCCHSAARCGVEQRTIMHLVPVSTHSYDERDLTVLTWAVGRGYGAGLQLSGETITVVNNGTYFIYSQVLYKDTTWVMGHVITKRMNGAETKLMKCLKSMPSNVSLPLNSCYTAGAHFLESGSVIELSIPRKSADLILSAQATFLGIFSV
ncbi:tumor necrosis factor ligand superfamily member 13 isoform X4 [Brachyhypopomus gauderio]|uniref:tumor necrosis factor ligand superfamily member 13 isoform X4 n=1 Tax=Brachyhypopomus gauderio TaxID=698409 RepID=UPI004041D5E4